MAVQMHFAGLLLTHRLMRISASTQKHLCSRGLILKLRAGTGAVRTFSAGSVKCNENDGDKSQSSPLDTKQTPRQEPVFRGRRRPLSPLERISGLLPQDSLSPEVMQLREQDQQDPVVEADLQVSAAYSTQEESRHEAVPKKDNSEHHSALDTAMRPNASETPIEAFNEVTPPALPGENRLVFGELLVAEYRKKGRVEFRKMFQLQTGTRLQSSWGTILHDDIAGQPAGRFLKTGRGVPILIRRASLEDYVLLMKRGPAIAYPKDAATMLMMMDVTEGDCVLESGSGSGAMSLFLSRAVGSKGSVLSMEVREDHHRRAVLNYRRWRTSWSLRRGEEWPDNVQFHNADLCTASSLLAGHGFNAVALDQIHPQLALPTVIPHLHSGAVCAVYLANITQVIDLLEGLRCLALPLLCERIIEVPLRDWLVAPALQKDGRFCIRKIPIVDADEREEGETPDDTSNETDEDEMTTEKHPAFGSIPYLARPHPEQMSHTAFLVKLRKCGQ